MLAATIAVTVCRNGDRGNTVKMRTPPPHGNSGGESEGSALFSRTFLSQEEEYCYIFMFSYMYTYAEFCLTTVVCAS